jgi:hypothetical protein
MYTYYVYIIIEIILRKKKLVNKKINDYERDELNSRALCLLYCFSRTFTDCNRRPYSRNTVVDTDTVERNSGGGGGGWRTESASAAALCAVVSPTRTRSNFFSIGTARTYCFLRIFTLFNFSSLYCTKTKTLIIINFETFRCYFFNHVFPDIFFLVLYFSKTYI